MIPSRLLIIFASADRYQALQKVINAIACHLKKERELKVIEMSGERLNLLLENKNSTISYFDHSQIVDDIWMMLNPHALEWWKLLGLEDKDSLELPCLPGIEDLTRIIKLAQVIDEHKDFNLLIVILPHPLHAIKLLQMAQKGPDLVEQLVDPLLNWWDKTRKSLSTVEKMFRLNLPSSKKLRLEDVWKRKFETLQRITSERNQHNFICFIDQESRNLDQLQHRFSNFALHGAFPTHLVIQDAEKLIVEQIRSDCSDIPFTLIKWPEEKQQNIAKMLLEAPSNRRTKFTNEENMSIHIFMPGVQKKSLRIKQTVDNIYLIYQGNHRAIEIPEAWKKMRCGRAQIKLSWLTLLFLDDIEDGLHPNHHATRKKGVPGRIGKIQPNTAKTSDT